MAEYGKEFGRDTNMAEFVCRRCGSKFDISHTKRWMYIACAAVCLPMAYFYVSQRLWWGIGVALATLAAIGCGVPRCTECRSKDVLPADSPRGKEFLENLENSKKTPQV